MHNCTLRRTHKRNSVECKITADQFSLGNRGGSLHRHWRQHTCRTCIKWNYCVLEAISCVEKLVLIFKPVRHWITCSQPPWISSSSSSAASYNWRKMRISISRHHYHLIHGCVRVCVWLAPNTGRVLRPTSTQNARMQNVIGTEWSNEYGTHAWNWNSHTQRIHLNEYQFHSAFIDKFYYIIYWRIVPIVLS